MRSFSRREFVETAFAAAAIAGLEIQGSGGAAAKDPPSQPPPTPQNAAAPHQLCAPIIRGHLRVFDRYLDIGGWRRELDEECRIGANLLWLSHMGHALDGSSRTRLEDVCDACAERGMRIIIETGHTPRWYVRRDLERERAVVRDTCAGIAARCGGHPAFFAAYVHHEIYMATGAFGAFVDDLYPAAVEECRRAFPGKPVTLSPFFILDQTKVFGDFYSPEPDEYREYWTRLIRRSGFDIIMLQDSGEHFSYVTNAQRRPFFEAMHGACKDGGATLWGNVESAEMVIESLAKYVEVYGRTHHSQAKGIPWRNVPIPRLEEKLLLAAAYAENIVSWGYWQFGRPGVTKEALVKHGLNSTGPIGSEWYEMYQEYYARVAAKQGA